MNWQFRLRNHPLPPTDHSNDRSQICPLLSLMSDGMASPKEDKEAQAHLQACDSCRQALLWIEATRQAISSRPVVLPPADMRARIARAIAASAETAVPAVPIAMPPARRRFAVRPAYATAASVAVAGAFFGHYLLTAGHAPGGTTLVPPVHMTSSGPGQTNSTASPKPGSAGHASAFVPRKQPLVVATLPHDAAAQTARVHGGGVRQSAPGNLARAPQTNLSPSRRPNLTAFLPPASAPRSPQNKPSFVQVAVGARRTLPSAAPRHLDQLASHPTNKPLAGVQTHTDDSKPLMASVPPAAAHAQPGPATTSPPPSPASAPAPLVARAPETPSVPAHAVPGDGLGGIRVSLASHRSEGYARRLFMASGVHLPQKYVTISAVWTPTSLSDTSAARRTASASSRPAAVQASPETVTVTPASAFTASNQRRSERDAQWSDAPANGGA